VIKTHCIRSQTQLVELEGGLLVTPYHPVRVGGVWTFPCDIAAPKVKNIDIVYNFALKDEHVLYINGVEIVGLGHEFSENAVISHAYFGSKAVIQDLEKMNGFKDGLVEFYPENFIRNESGLVTGLTASILV